jgi:nitrate reductase gamma subunit
MKPMAFLVGSVLPYVAALVFLVGVVHRLVGWWRCPRPPRMPLYPVWGSGGASLAREALLFPSLRRGDGRLWVLAWSFHAALALAFVGHIRAFTPSFDRGLLAVGVRAQWLEVASAWMGGLAGVLLLVAGLGLLVRRIVLARVREISGPPDYFALALLLAVIVSGNLMRLTAGDVALAETRRFVSSLIALAPIAPTAPTVLAHLCFAELLVAYLAFSKLMHFGGFFFTFPLIKRSTP